MTKTKERLMVATGGWDGTGYNVEAKERPIYTNCKGDRFIKARFNGVWSYLKISGERHKVSGELMAFYYDDCAVADEYEKIMTRLNKSRKTA